MVFAVTFGYVIGVLLAFFLARRLLGKMAERMARHDNDRRWIQLVGGIFGTLALAPGIFMAVILGGYISGPNASAIEGVIGEGDTRMFLALVFGIVLVTTVTVTTAAAIGGAFGRMFARSLFPGRPA
jgi:hypothetical protein